MEADAAAGAPVADPLDAAGAGALRALRSLRAVRRFTDEPVADADLDRILEAGRWTGSARNRQPWRVAVGEFDLGRLAQTLMLAAAALGLGTCPVTFFPDANVARATAIAGLAPPWRVRTGIALGRPAPPAPRAVRPAIPTGRLPLADLRIDPEGLSRT